MTHMALCTKFKNNQYHDTYNAIFFLMPFSITCDHIVVGKQTTRDILYWSVPVLRAVEFKMATGCKFLSFEMPLIVYLARYHYEFL